VPKLGGTPNDKDIVTKQRRLGTNAFKDNKGLRVTLVTTPSITDVYPRFFEAYSSYADYYSPTPKVIITLTRRAKLTNVRAILNTSTKISIVTLDATLRFKILITYNLGIVLRTIVKNKSRFVRFIDNIIVTIRNIVVRTRFYIIDCPSVKVIPRFLFFRKVRVTLRYPRNKEDRPVYILFYNPRTREIISVKTNTKIEKVRET